MEESNFMDLDLEFKRYLQILRPYLGQLTNENVIAICNAWIQRLSDCSENEKALRNKYVFSLCYQLAKGALEGPFLKYPPCQSLLSGPESVNSEDSSSEIECAVVNADDPNTQVLYNNKQTTVSDTEFRSQDHEHSDAKLESQYDSDVKSSHCKSKSSRKRSIICFACPETFKYNNLGEMYEHRAKSLIQKLRDIKTKNTMLHNEILSLKEESTIKNFNEVDDIIRVDNATSAFIQNNESSATLKSLRFQLHEVQESRNGLIDKISCLQEKLDTYEEIKNHEIEELEAKYKLEIINIRTTVRNEVKEAYERKIDEMKTSYEAKIQDIENTSKIYIQDLKISNDDVVTEKNKTIEARDLEISRLNNQIDDLKNHLHTVLEKFIDKPTIDSDSGESWKTKAQQLEKRLNKMEKNKIKCTRMYEAKVAQLHRDKHLAECSLQLQMVKQRAQVVNEVTDENQTELTTALEKLEMKYKEIVANVQTTAIQRRVQDQMTLETILQAACGVPHESINQFSKTMRNQSQSYDSEVSPLTQCNKGNKSYGEDHLDAGFCLNGERIGELFERVYIPQRDNTEVLK